MGFFERFRKRVQEVADETDLDELTAEEGTEEAQEKLNPLSSDVIEDEWEEPTEIEPPTFTPSSDDNDDEGWDDWDDEPTYRRPVEYY